MSSQMSFYNIGRLQSLKTVPTFIAANTLQFIIIVLLRCLIRVFSSKDLLKTSDTSATRNVRFNMHVLFTSHLAIFPFLHYFMLLLTVLENALDVRFFYITFKTLFQVTKKFGL